MKILILDIETTGFLGQGGCIVEIGIVELNLKTGKIKEVFNSLVKEKELSLKHTENPYGWIFNHSDLTYEDLLKAPLAKNVYKEVQKILDEYPAGVTAFNKRFDFDFLDSRGINIEYELPCLMKTATDIYKIKRKGRSGYKFPNVEEAYKFLLPESDYTEPHRGSDDAYHEAEIAYVLYKLKAFKVK